MAKPTFAEICAIAMNQGVSLNTVRQWKKRTKIPLEWQIKIVQITGGQVTLADMQPIPMFGEDKSQKKGNSE